MSEDKPVIDVEPEFTIKAHDALALDRLQAGIDLCRARGLDAQAEQEQKALDEMRAWQERHPDRVKNPDHEHVPAGFQPRSRWRPIDMANPASPTVRFSGEVDGG